MATSARQTKTGRMEFRVSALAKATLEQAAAIRHTKLTDFVLAAAMREADHVLADRTRFALDAERWEQFSMALEAPAEVNPRLAAFVVQQSALDEDRAKAIEAMP